MRFCMKTSTDSNQSVPFLNGTLSPVQFAFLKSLKVSGISQEIFDPKTMQSFQAWAAQLSGLVCPGNAWTSRLSQITVCSKGEGFQVITWKLKIEVPRSCMKSVELWYERKKNRTTPIWRYWLIHILKLSSKKLFDQIPKDWKTKAWDWKVKILRALH